MSDLSIPYKNIQFQALENQFNIILISQCLNKMRSHTIFLPSTCPRYTTKEGRTYSNFEHFIHM